MVVEPSEKKGFWAAGDEDCQALPVVQEAYKLGVADEIDTAEELSTDELPEESEDQVLLHLDDVMSPEIYDHQFFGLFGSLEDSVYISGDLEDGLLVALTSHRVQVDAEAELIQPDGLRIEVMDDVSQDDAVPEVEEQVFRLEGQIVLEFLLVVLEDCVQVFTINGVLPLQLHTHLSAVVAVYRRHL
jgi:hypothetical protein